MNGLHRAGLRFNATADRELMCEVCESPILIGAQFRQDLRQPVFPLRDGKPLLCVRCPACLEREQERIEKFMIELSRMERVMPETNSEKMIELIESVTGPLCDDCISMMTVISPRQTINQRMRQWEKSGKIIRTQSICHKCKKLKKTNQILEPRMILPVRAEGKDVTSSSPNLEEARNQLLRFCKRLWEGHCSLKSLDGISVLIGDLAEKEILTMHIANMMHTIRCLRNAYVYEDVPLGKRERAILENAWSIIEEWAESNHPDPWRLREKPSVR